jgi:hypothetical protein
MTLPNGITWREAIEWLWRALTVLLIPLGIWLVTTLNSIDRRLTETANRVTVLEQSTLRTNDGTALYQGLAIRPTREELQDNDGTALYQGLAIRPTREELQDKLDRLEAIIVRIEVKLDEYGRGTQ